MKYQTLFIRRTTKNRKASKSKDHEAFREYIRTKFESFTRRSDTFESFTFY